MVVVLSCLQCLNKGVIKFLIIIYIQSYNCIDMSVILKEMLSEFVYGGMDGVITTVAIIAGTMGADISTKYALILGFSNILADGFSMGISRYNSLVDIVATNSELSRTSPILSALATFFFFVLMGLIPLFPFLMNIEKENIRRWLVLSSFVAFLIIGGVKGFYSRRFKKSLLEVVVIGSIGAAISYFVASYMNHRFEHTNSKTHGKDNIRDTDSEDDSVMSDDIFSKRNKGIYPMLY
jgi:VIT1/CCC1 family predicted Fe2+/Mn2+ transporter